MDGKGFREGYAKQLCAVPKLPFRYWFDYGLEKPRLPMGNSSLPLFRKKTRFMKKKTEFSEVHCFFGNILILSAPGLVSEPETQSKTCGMVFGVFETL